MMKLSMPIPPGLNSLYFLFVSSVSRLTNLLQDILFPAILMYLGVVSSIAASAVNMATLSVVVNSSIWLGLPQHKMRFCLNNINGISVVNKSMKAPLNMVVAQWAKLSQVFVKFSS